MSHPIKSPRKLIEVALPLDAINIAAAGEKSIRQGHPSSLHLWWARRPLAAARAVIFAQFVNDPGYQQGGGFKYGKNKKEAAIERKRLFKIIEDLVVWENTKNEVVLARARAEICRSWREVCELNKDHPQSVELFNPDKLPALHDPFAGGGAIPLEAQRLGLDAYASDLNPVPVLINKAMIEIPPKFAGQPPVSPTQNVKRAKGDLGLNQTWKGAMGLAEDVRYYGTWMFEEAKKRIGSLYPSVEITKEMSSDRPDLKKLVGKKLDVIAWLWARTVKSPNPAFSKIDVPLIGSFTVATQGGKTVWIEPVIDQKKGEYNFAMRVGGKPKVSGTITRTGAECLVSGTPMSFAYIRNEAKAQRMGSRLMGIVAKYEGEKIFLPPTEMQESILLKLKTEDSPPGDIPEQALGIRVQLYGITKYADLFNKRQLKMLITLTDIVQEITTKKFPELATLEGYANAVRVYLALSIGRYADYGSSMTFWDERGPSIQKTFGLPTLQMRWSYPETNPFGDFSGSYSKILEAVVDSLDGLSDQGKGSAEQLNAIAEGCRNGAVVSTDPPYYDNIGYAALSDYFYVWLRRSLRDVYPELFATILTPKESELIAEPGRHESKEAAAKYFETGFASFAKQLAAQAHPEGPITIYYAFKQAEVEADGGDVVSTGWEVFLGGLIGQGWEIVGTWPMRTEQKGGLRTAGRNSLASSIILVCRKRPADATTISRREFLRDLNAVLPEALDEMTRGAGGEHSPVAPVDLSQAIIGPGMGVFSKYAAVLEADGSPMSVRTALQLINRFLAEDDFDHDTQFCMHWFEQHGWTESAFGEADTLARAKGTSVDGVKEAGIIKSGGGKVRLLKWSEYPEDWDPRTDKRMPVWEALHHLIRTFRQGGDSASGALLAALGGKAEAVRQLAYRLYTLCERLGQAEDARAYNELITSWTGIESAAATAPKPAAQELPGFER